MSAKAALSKLAERIALFSTEYRKLKKLNEQLSEEVKRLNSKIAVLETASGKQTGRTDSRDLVTGSLDVVAVREKLDEMLDELKDIN